jgi:hypothetical protein
MPPLRYRLLMCGMYWRAMPTPTQHPQGHQTQAQRITPSYPLPMVLAWSGGRPRCSAIPPQYASVGAVVFMSRLLRIHPFI